MIRAINEIYLKNFNSLYAEIEQYSNEEDLWVIDKQILNCAGNLALHLTGNINYFVGAILGNTGYVREREKEFTDKHVPKQKLLEQIRTTSDMLQKTLGEMDEKAAEEKYPLDKFGDGRSTAYVLMYLLAHLNYHLGQINYHRRLLSTGSAA